MNTSADPIVAFRARTVRSSWSCALFLLGMLVSAVFAAPAPAEEMRFRNECFANATESCFVVAEGGLDAGAAERFQSFLESGVDGYQVLLDSPGGNLSAGLKLGRAIRARGMHTVIGRWNSAEPSSEPLDDAECLSACAYAFLGGEVRTVREGNRLGFHQFALPGGDLVKGPEGLSSGQQVSAILISYLVEMGVDARLFGLATGAASDQMFYPSRTELADYDVVTQRGFDHFTLEPYRDGIVAGSRRLDSPRVYDEAAHLTAFCRDGAKYFLLTANALLALEPGTEPLHAGIFFDAARNGIEIPAGRTRTWVSKKASHAQLELTSGDVERILRAGRMGVYFVTGRAGGGTLQADVEMNEMDKRMLEAAFRYCI